MGRIAKCNVCNIELSSENRIKYKSKLYCVSCCNIKKENELLKLDKSSNTIKTDSGYSNLIKLICEYYNIKVPTGLIIKQIKDYAYINKYSYDGMSYTLWYCKFRYGCFYFV